MIKYPFATLALTIAVLTVAACVRTAVDLPPGQYESKTSSTDSRDTTTEKETSATVGYDSHGNKKAIVKSKTSIDPPGLFNKSTSETDQVIER